MMMESMINLPDDMFRQELLPYLTVYDIVNLDNACMNHKYRPQLMDKIHCVILIGGMYESMKASFFKWLGMRRIYLINMNRLFEDEDDDDDDRNENDDDSHNLVVMENDYKDQFRYSQHIVMSGPIRDIISIFIITHCPCLLSMDIIDYYWQPTPPITDQTLESIAEHCTGLESLSLSDCRGITDAGLITMSERCSNLRSLKVDKYYSISDASIISISTHCTGLQLLNVGCCSHITDTSIISICTNCSGLLSLDLDRCHQITDASIKSLYAHCTELQSLFLNRCHKITDASIISISENCKVIKELIVSFTNITDASLIAIAKNCTGLKFLSTDDCDSLSSDVLRDYFDSLSKLRAALLSIYPSLQL